MAYFEWADDMVIDGWPIDSHHKELVGLIAYSGDRDQ